MFLLDVFLNLDPKLGSGFCFSFNPLCKYTLTLKRNIHPNAGFINRAVYELVEKNGEKKKEKISALLLHSRTFKVSVTLPLAGFAVSQFHILMWHHYIYSTHRNKLHCCSFFFFPSFLDENFLT